MVYIQKDKLSTVHTHHLKDANAFHLPFSSYVSTGEFLSPFFVLCGYLIWPLARWYSVHKSKYTGFRTKLFHFSTSSSFIDSIVIFPWVKNALFFPKIKIEFIVLSISTVARENNSISSSWLLRYGFLSGFLLKCSQL